MRFFKMAVAIDQHHGFKPFNRPHRCRLQSSTQFDSNIHELSPTNLTHSLKQAFELANIHRSFSAPCFPLATSARSEEEFDANPRIEIVGGHGVPPVRALVVEVATTMASIVDPLPASSGLGGAYFLRNKNGDNIAVAKPIDEEPLAFNNPKGFGGLMLGQSGMKRSVRVGGTGIRELAAYLLDHEGFAGVPPTALVKLAPVRFHINSNNNYSNNNGGAAAKPYKIASLQRYVDHDFDAGELGPAGFSVSSVHRIGIFDVRLLNLDRHAGNILVKKNDQHENYAVGVAELVPIDHGLCLPEWLDSPYFEWMHWPQASVPFSDSEFDYISNLDPSKDAQLLSTQLPSLRESSIRLFILCTIFLKRAASAGLCLADIGEMMTRKLYDGEENLSELENICARAKATVVNISDNDNGKENNDQNRDKKNDVRRFEFDNISENASNEVLYLPHVLRCPPKIPRFASVRSMPRLHDSTLSPLYVENDHQDGDIHDHTYKTTTTITRTSTTKIITENGDNESGDGSKVGGSTRSISCLVKNNNCESEGISFKDMSGDEWVLFLECFEKLLLEVLQGKKSIGPKKRLGTS